MFFKKKKINILNNSIEKLNDTLQKGNIEDLTYILGNKKEIIIRNLIAGLFRGVGIGIGVTIITAILIMILNKIVALNIPVIGKYVTDIVEIVESNK